MNNSYITLEDKTILDLDERIVFFSVDRFMKDITLGNCCFICGARPSEKDFNDEHIIPDWILRKYQLQNRNITLPNMKIIKYSQYKVPCCIDCNTMLGNNIEEPIRNIIDGGYDSLVKYIKQDGFWMIFKWLSLIFLKVHLKDKHYRLILDKREPEYKISELYDWESFHHIHCVARSLYTGCQIDSNVFSSFFVVPVKIEHELEQFDYVDIFPGKGILIRLGEICIIAILNDSCGSLNLFQDDFNKINGFLSPLQYREMLARLSYINVNLKNRPKYYTELDPIKGLTIKADIPAVVEFEDKKEYNLGDFLFSSCYDIISHSAHPDKDLILEKVKQGNWTFLFDEKGNFIKNEMILEK